MGLLISFLGVVFNWEGTLQRFIVKAPGEGEHSLDNCTGHNIPLKTPFY